MIYITVAKSGRCPDPSIIGAFHKIIYKVSILNLEYNMDKLLTNNDIS